MAQAFCLHVRLWWAENADRTGWKSMFENLWVPASRETVARASSPCENSAVAVGEPLWCRVPAASFRGLHAGRMPAPQTSRVFAQALPDRAVGFWAPHGLEGHAIRAYVGREQQLKSMGTPPR